MAILTIARFTLIEVSRRRLVLAVGILTIALGLLSAWGFRLLLHSTNCGPSNRPCTALELKVIAATLLIMLMFMFSFVLALGAAFVGAPSIATEVESGIALAILPRPIRRSEVVLGKWLGLAVFIALYATVACGLEFTIVRYAMDYVPPHPILAIAFVIAEAFVLLALTMAGSTRLSPMTCGIIVLILYGATWLAGVVGAIGAFVHAHKIEQIGKVSSLLLPTDGLWRAATYNLQPAAFTVANADAGVGRNPFMALSATPNAYVMFSACWIVAVLGIAMWSFSRREL